jgi:hypothetical protein
MLQPKPFIRNNMATMSVVRTAVLKPAALQRCQPLTTLVRPAIGRSSLSPIRSQMRGFSQTRAAFQDALLPEPTKGFMSRLFSPKDMKRAFVRVGLFAGGAGCGYYRKE